jgi:hypothetical protein
MACFITPAATAIIATAIKKKIPSHWHFDWLLLMLWGGTLMLIVDHVVNGEVILTFPFFTAGWSEIWPELIRVGLPMTLAIFIAWGIMVFLKNYQTKSLAKRA